MEWLLTEEVALLLATFAACGLLVLGILELIWPTRPRRSGAAREPRRAPAAPPVEDRAAVALRVGRTLLDRALEDPDPASDRRLTMISRAIACLARGIEAAPDDPRLREILAAAHDALAKTDQQAALRRLAADMPWRPPVFAQAGPAAGPR